MALNSSIFLAVHVIYVIISSAGSHPMAEGVARVLIPGSPMVMSGLMGNLSNQRWTIMNTILAGRHWNASIVIPPWKVSDDTETGAYSPAAQYAMTWTLWDVRHLEEMAAMSHLKIHMPSREEYAELCPEWLHGTVLQDAIEQFKKGQVHSLCMAPDYCFYQLWRDILSDTPGIAQDVVGSINPMEWHKWYLNNGHFHWARSYLRPSPRILHQAEEAASEIRALYSVEYFFALHHRQGDFATACNAWGNTVIDGMKCYVSPNETHDILHRVYQIPEHVVLLIAPPQPLHSLGKLCQTYQCMHREMLPEYMKATEGLMPMMLAQYQFALAMQSARAFGNIYSSWSVELIANMRLAGKPADLINPHTCM